MEYIREEKKPNVIQKLGNNTYYYNYNIQPTKITLGIMEGEKTVDGWQYIQAYVHGQPNAKSCIKALIRKFVSQEEEFDLINSYNNAMLNEDFYSEDIVKYKEYLKIVDDIKREVNKEFTNR